MTLQYFADFKSQIAHVNRTVYGDRADQLTNWSIAERDHINAMATEDDRNIELYPVVHAWRTNYCGGSQLTFWCKYCRDDHVHGRHTGPGRYIDDNDNVVALKPKEDSVLALQVRKLWRNYVRRFEQCRFNPNAPGGRGICTCPMGSGDGHRVAHCHKRDSAYYDHGYVLHEVAPNDPRATARPRRTRRAT